jgi:hypothetical protein
VLQKVVQRRQPDTDGICGTISGNGADRGELIRSVRPFTPSARDPSHCKEKPRRWDDVGASLVLTSWGRGASPQRAYARAVRVPVTDITKLRFLSLWSINMRNAVHHRGHGLAQ